jgi:hypothetical protein
MANAHLSLFRVKVDMLIDQYVQRLKVFVAENRLMGSGLDALRAQKEKDISRWKFNRDALGKAIKKEVAGLVNKVYLTAYMDGLKKGKPRVQ